MNFRRYIQTTANGDLPVKAEWAGAHHVAPRVLSVLVSGMLHCHHPHKDPEQVTRSILEQALLNKS